MYFGRLGAFVFLFGWFEGFGGLGPAQSIMISSGEPTQSQGSGFCDLA